MHKTPILLTAALLLASLAAAPAANADPGVSVCPKYLQQCIVTVYVTDDGAACFYFSQQVPTCTPSGTIPDGLSVCIRSVQCLLTVYFTDDGVCFYFSEQVPTCVSLA